ncbi:hypothetical protein D3C83_115170 [compost metagenome]
MPMWMFFAPSLRPGMSRSRPRGAPVPTNTASNFCSSKCCIESIFTPPLNSTPRPRM